MMPLVNEFESQASDSFYSNQFDTFFTQLMTSIIPDNLSLYRKKYLSLLKRNIKTQQDLNFFIDELSNPFGTMCETEPILD